MKQLIKPIAILFALVTLASCDKEPASISNEFITILGAHYLNGTRHSTSLSNSSNTPQFDTTIIQHYEIVCTPLDDNKLMVQYGRDNSFKYTSSETLEPSTDVLDGSCANCMGFKKVDSYGSSYYVTELVYNPATKKIHSMIMKSSFGGSGGSSSSTTVLTEQ